MLCDSSKEPFCERRYLMYSSIYDNMSIMKKILFFLKPFIYIIRYVGEGDNVLLFRGCNSKNARYTR